MTRNLALCFLTAAMVGLVICGWIGGDRAALLYAWLSALTVPALAAVGAARADGKLDRNLVFGLGGLAVWLLLCFSLLWIWRLGAPAPGLPRPERILGLPATLAIQIYGIFLLPTPFVAWLYASTFARSGLTEESLGRLRSDFGPETKGR